MECKYCKGKCQKAGRQKNGVQKFFCRQCSRYQQSSYIYNASRIPINKMISTLVCESVSIRGIARVLQVAVATVISRIKQIARAILKPPVPVNRQSVQVDEMITYIKRKQNRFCIVYALCSHTKQVIDFAVGRRNKKTLGIVIKTLLLSGAGIIHTDRFSVYGSLIPKVQHNTAVYATNAIERKNLDIRNCLKRLARKTICFSKNITMLEACLRIYFWGNLW